MATPDDARFSWPMTEDELLALLPPDRRPSDLAKAKVSEIENIWEKRWLSASENNTAGPLDSGRRPANASRSTGSADVDGLNSAWSRANFSVQTIVGLLSEALEEVEKTNLSSGDVPEIGQLINDISRDFNRIEREINRDLDNAICGVRTARHKFDLLRRLMITCFEAGTYADSSLSRAEIEVRRDAHERSVRAGLESVKQRRDRADKGWRKKARVLAREIWEGEPKLTQEKIAGKLEDGWKERFGEDAPRGYDTFRAFVREMFKKGELSSRPQRKSGPHV